MRLLRPCLLLCGIVLAPAACSSPPPPAAVSAPALEADVGKTEVSALDIDTVRFSFRVEVTNPGADAAVVDLTTAKLFVEDHPIDSRRSAAPVPVAAGKSTSIPFQFDVSRAALENFVPGYESLGDAAWRFHADLKARLADGKSSRTAADATGTFPNVHSPGLQIVSLKIERYDLIETKLKLTVAVRNPNSFPLAFRSVDYLFSADGQIWGEGTAAIPQALPAGDTTDVQIPLTLNFIEMGRQLLDRVAALGIVHYRLQATTSVTTPLSFLHEFSSKFDREGAIKVEE